MCIRDSSNWYHLEEKTIISIGHFRVHLSLHFKARLSAKSLLGKSVFIHIEIETNYHNKNFALRLALKERLRGTRKWPIQLRPFTFDFVFSSGNFFPRVQCELMVAFMVTFENQNSSYRVNLDQEKRNFFRVILLSCDVC